MKAQKKRNLKYRNKFKDQNLVELTQYIKPALQKNKILTDKYQQYFNFNETEVNKESNLPSISKIRNVCVLTGRSRALIQTYKLSRIKFKEFAEAG